MLDGVKVVAWDYDGVLNRNIQSGRFLWADNFERDLGQSLSFFENYMFCQNLADILTGKEDLRDRVMAWGQEVGFAPGPDQLLDYWFSRDSFPDPEIPAVMKKLSDRGFVQVIATNNETRRVRYIEENLGWGRKVDRVFASGRLGIAKPDLQFYDAVTAALGVDPHEILFFDDGAENVGSARSYGWSAHHFTEETRPTLLADLAACLR
ncbi:HAD family hydrolase [Rhodovibrionaceae bacterium A322]